MSEVAQLEQQLEFQQHLKARRLVAERLAANSDFKSLILHGFCRDDAARYVQESGDPILTAEQRADALAMAQASGHLKRYLQLQIQMGAMSDRNIADIEEELAEVRTEEGAQ